MARDIAAYSRYQVFLNYPYDDDFAELADAMMFAVVAAGLIPVSAKDMSVPDKSRLDGIVEAISCCDYSAHDFSRFTGEGEFNFARMNMPIEMGMAVFHALKTQRVDHQCSFFVPSPHEYKSFASDLSGLDPRCHYNEPDRMVVEMYGMVARCVPAQQFSSQPPPEVVAQYYKFREWREALKGSGRNGEPSHLEARELIYQVCSRSGWWDWRRHRAGMQEFPEIPLLWEDSDPREQ